MSDIEVNLWPAGESNNGPPKSTLKELLGDAYYAFKDIGVKGFFVRANLKNKTSVQLEFKNMNEEEKLVMLGWYNNDRQKLQEENAKLKKEIKELKQKSLVILN